MEEYQEYIQERLRELDLSELAEIPTENGLGDLPGVSEIIENLLTGEQLFDVNGIISNLKDLFFAEVKSSLLLGVGIVAICVIIGLLKSLATSFGEKAVSNIAIMISSCVVIALCLSSFRNTYALCVDAVGTMTHTMQILLPIVIPLLVSMGGITSGGILSPLLMGVITAFNTLLSKVVLPMLFFSAIFLLINSVTEKDYVNKLAVFIRSAAVFITGLCATFFSGITVVQGFAAESADGILINTARFSLNNFIPIVGGFAADSVDMMLRCVGIIKNAVSIFGIIIIGMLLLIPLLKLLAIVVIYKLTAILTEPIGLENISDCLNEMGNAVVTMCVVLFLTAMMFLIFIAIILSIGGAGL